MDAQTKNRIKEIFQNYPQEESLILTSNGDIYLIRAKEVVADYCHRNGLTFEIITRNQIENNEENNS